MQCLYFFLWIFRLCRPVFVSACVSLVCTIGVLPDFSQRGKSILQFVGLKISLPLDQCIQVAGWLALPLGRTGIFENTLNDPSLFSPSKNHHASRLNVTSLCILYGATKTALYLFEQSPSLYFFLGVTTILGVGGGSYFFSGFVQFSRKCLKIVVHVFYLFCYDLFCLPAIFSWNGISHLTYLLGLSRQIF